MSFINNTFIDNHRCREEKPPPPIYPIPLFPHPIYSTAQQQPENWRISAIYFGCGAFSDRPLRGHGAGDLLPGRDNPVSVSQWYPHLRLPAVRPDAARSCAGLQTVKWINFFEAGDSALLHALQNPRVNIAGIRRADILPTCKCSRQPGCRGKKVARARR